MRCLRTTVLLLTSIASTARAADFGPFASPGFPVTKDAAARAGGRSLSEKYGAQPFYAAFDFYRRYLTKIDGPVCPHRPTCSMYAMQAVNRYGLWLGGWLAADRLWRGKDSSALRELPRSPQGYYLDPLDAALFWRSEAPPRDGRSGQGHNDRRTAK